MTPQNQTSVPRGAFLSTIAGKITLRMLLVAAIPVLAVGALTVGSLFALADRADERLEASRAELAEETIGANQADQADLVLARMSSYVNERIGDTIDWSRAETIVDATSAEYPELEELAGLEDSVIDSRFDTGYRLDSSGRSNRWLRTQISDQDAYAEAIVTDARGLTIGYANNSIDFTSADQEWWTKAWSEGAFLGPVQLDGETGLLSFDIAVRVDDTTTRRPLGVLMVTVDVASLQPFADEFADETSQTEVSVLAGSGLLLAETETDHDPSRVASELPFEAEHAEAYGNALASPDQIGVLLLDDTVGGFARAKPALFVPRLGIEVENHDWVAFVEQPATAALQPLDGLESLSSDLSNTARVLTIVIAGLVVAALLLAFLLARLLAKRIARPINQLRVEANRLADRELPQLISSLQASDVTGEIPVVTPIAVDADGEVAELASAFNSVRITAVELAAEQAIGRSKDVSNILLNLGRRNQQLVGRQLRFIDDLERSESDPDTLRSLFTLDQMATRMRRNAESLLVLAGEDSPRRVSEPKQVEEIVRAASGEVEDYARVRLASADATLIQPRIVNDLTHLLAELIENATNFSPPDELIEVIGGVSPDGSYTISVVDRGVGIPIDRLNEANLRLRDPASSGGDTTSSFLGLYVVARLAARHNIDVRLVESVTSGITAKVTLPPEAIAKIPRPVTEVNRSTLRNTETSTDRDTSAPSWPPPKVEHARSSDPIPLPVRATATTPAVESGMFAAANAMSEPGSELEPGFDTGSATGPEPDSNTEPASQASTPPIIELPKRPVNKVDDETTQSILGLRSLDSTSVVPPPVTAAQRPRDADTPAPPAEPVSTSEDETLGLPIPPFRARQSNLPIGPPNVVDDEPQLDGEVERPGAPVSRSRFQVRRRIRRSDTSSDGGLVPADDVPTQDKNAARSRADEVRAKLTRFASGVEAARSGSAPLPSPEAPNGTEETSGDNSGNGSGAERLKGDTSGNGHETMQD